MSAHEKAPPAIAAILVGIDIDAAYVIATQSKASAAQLRAEGFRGWACWEDYNIGVYHGDRENVEVTLGRVLIPGEVLALEACVRHYLRAVEEGATS